MTSPTPNPASPARHEAPKTLDPVVLLVDVPAQGLLCGQVGTVVEDFRNGAYEVEFVDDQGRTYALATLRAEHLIVLRYRPAKVA